ncbi:MAG: hypothetical protein J6D30_00235 [Clostridia bacterium]|nr:hypothetical protein [Clostridia bacterium]
MEQAVEKKTFDLNGLVMRILGGLTFAAQIVLTLLFLFGVGGGFAGTVSVDTFIDQALAITELDFTSGFPIVFDTILRYLVDAGFVIAFIVMTVASIITVVKNITTFKKAVFDGDKTEGWECVQKLKKGLGKVTAHIVTYSMLSATVVQTTLLDSAVAGLWIGFVGMGLTAAGQLLFKDDKIPNWPYILIECLKVALKVVILVLFSTVFTGTYIADAVNSFSFALCGAVSGGLDIQSTMFIDYMYTFAMGLFFFSMMATWLEIVKHSLRCDQEKATSFMNRYLPSVIVFAIIDFAAHAFFLGTYGEVDFVEKFSAWFGGEAMKAFIPLLCLVIAGMLSESFPEVTKDTVWFAKKEVVEATEETVVETPVETPVEMAEEVVEATEEAAVAEEPVVEEMVETTEEVVENVENSEE